MVGSCTTLIGKSAIAQVERTPMVKPGQTWKNATVHNSSGFSEVRIGMSAFVRITKLQNPMVKPMVRHGATLCITVHHFTFWFDLSAWWLLIVAGNGRKTFEIHQQMLGYHNLEGYLQYLPVQMNKNIIKHRSDPWDYLILWIDQKLAKLQQ